MTDQLPLFAAIPVDPRYDHVWAWGRPSKALLPYEPQRKGRRCRVVCRGRGPAEPTGVVGVVGVAGKPAGPLQAALIRQLDAGRHVSERQLLEAALRDRGCRVTIEQHRGALVPTGQGAPLSPASPAAQATARTWTEALFWRKWREKITAGS